MDANEQAKRLMQLAPCDWQGAADKLGASGRDEIRRALEGVAVRAAELARYMDERAGSGCGDQGHAKAVKAANKAGRKVWCGVFGYNDFIDFTV